MITEISIKNYKSILDAKVKLGPLNVLIGANNTGKSNFLEVLTYFSNIPRYGLGQAFKRKDFGVFYPKFKNDNEFKKIEIGYGFKSKISGEDVNRYSIGICENGQGEPALNTENLTFNGKDLIVTQKNGEELSSQIHKGQKAQLPINESYFRQFFDKVGTGIQDEFTSMVYSFNPKKIKKSESYPSDISSFNIKEDGEGTAIVVDQLASKILKKHKMFMDKIREFAPEVEHVTAPEVESNRGRILAVTEENMDEAVSGESISDGLAILISIFATMYYKTSIRTIGIEEPENGIHPRRLIDLANYFKQIAEKNENGNGEYPQIIISTHSPYLLDYFEDMPETVILVEREPGKGTRFTPLTEMLEKKRPDLQEVLDKKAMSLGEMWFNGYLGGVPK